MTYGGVVGTKLEPQPRVSAFSCFGKQTVIQFNSTRYLLSPWVRHCARCYDTVMHKITLTLLLQSSRRREKLKTDFKNVLKQWYQCCNKSSRRASAQTQCLCTSRRASNWWQRKEGFSTCGTPLLTHKLRFMCVAKTSSKAQLENIPHNVCLCRAFTACHLHTPVSRTCALSCFNSSNYGSYSAIYTLWSGSLGDQGHTFVKQLDKGKDAKSCNKTIYLYLKLKHIKIEPLSPSISSIMWPLIPSHRLL